MKACLKREDVSVVVAVMTVWRMTNTWTRVASALRCAHRTLLTSLPLVTSSDAEGFFRVNDPVDVQVRDDCLR